VRLCAVLGIVWVSFLSVQRGRRAVVNVVVAAGNVVVDDDDDDLLSCDEASKRLQHDRSIAGKSRWLTHAHEV
jgi:hypothetical protein